MVRTRRQTVTRVSVPFTLASYAAATLSINFLVQGHALADTLPTIPVLTAAGTPSLGEGTSCGPISVCLKQLVTNWFGIFPVFFCIETFPLSTQYSACVSQLYLA